jgi:4-hydroxy-2,2'-bipyrrole-5-methanol dehydrogenase
MIDPLTTIETAAKLARWAPSSHNSQPWTVTIGPLSADGSRTVDIKLSAQHRLRALETLQAEMAISLGLFAGLFCEVLDQTGLTWGKPTILSSGLSSDQPSGHPEGMTLTVGPVSCLPKPCPPEFEALVRQRRTSRAPFHHRPLSHQQLSVFQPSSKAGLGVGTAAKPLVFQERAMVRGVADLVRRFGALDFSNFAAWSETYAHVHFTEAAKLQTGRGFSIEALLGKMSGPHRLLMRLLLHPWTMQALRPIGFPGSLADGLAGLVRDAPGLLVLVMPDPKPGFSDLLETGGLLRDLWLSAEKSGVQIHPLSVLLQHEEPRAALRALLGLADQPVFIARIGESIQPALSTPRVSLDEILTHAAECSSPVSVLHQAN